MVIYKYKSEERKGCQQHTMVLYCKSYWSELKNANYSYYPDIMNMKTRIWNDKHKYNVALTYHLNPNKW